MAAASVHSYIEEKTNESRDIIDNIYTNKILYTEILYLMENGYNKHLEYKMNKLFESQDNKYNGFENYFNSCLLRDAGMTGISIYSIKQDEAFVYSLNCGVVFPKDGYVINAIGKFNNSFESLRILPSHNAHYLRNSNRKNVFSMAYIVKEKFTSNNLGFIVIDYAVDSIKNKLSASAKEYHVGITVFTPQGGIIYDLLGKPEYHNLFSDLKNNNTSSAIHKNNMIHTITSGSVGIVTAAVLPRQSVFSHSSVFTKTIFFIACIFIIAILVFTAFSIKRFSTRIASLVHGTKIIKQGNLSYRIDAAKNGDELSEIAVSFNDMCEDLKNYIDRAYVSEINQKNAQIKELQAQINPHFLYNTLESIRMRILAGENKEAGDMIYLLSKYYRSTVKEKMVINIWEEIRHAKMYVELHNIRSSYVVFVKFNIEEELSDYGILKHTLQPLIENYICHGINMEREDNLLNINVYKNEKDIFISLEDNGNGISKEKLDDIKENLERGSNNTQSGIGIKNVHDRIVLFFGEGYGLTIKSSTGQGTSITIRIPAIPKEEMEVYVQSFHRG
ncbi:MAG TPA: histidine kinase [Pseudobacteroides sp.]|uniref:sensor histidine kinase n=1 Tax=Pseudobacteroides sp. TaxID=1968840 RepID=UPI002F957275